MKFNLSQKQRLIIYVMIYLLIISFLYQDSISKVFIKSNNQNYLFENGSIKFYSCNDFDCADTLSKLINYSTETKCVFYDLTEEKILNNIVINKNKTEILMYDKNYVTHLNKTFSERNKNIIPINSKGLLHNKFCIFEDELSMTGSWNPTHKGTYKNDNYIVLVKSKKINDLFYEKENELFLRANKSTDLSLFNSKNNSDHLTNSYKHINLSGSLIDVYFCPEDNCEDKILNELNKAKKEIRILAFSFTSNKIGDILIKKHCDESVNVSVVFEKTRISKYSQFSKLNKSNITTFFDGNKYTMHEKLIIVDNSTIIIGSYNPTKNANTLNDENILIIRNDAEMFKQTNKEFNRIKYEALEMK